MSEKRGCKICHFSKIKVCKKGKGGKRKNESAKNNKAKEIKSKKIRCANKIHRKQKILFFLISCYIRDFTASQNLVMQLLTNKIQRHIPMRYIAGTTKNK